MLVIAVYSFDYMSFRNHFKALGDYTNYTILTPFGVVASTLLKDTVGVYQLPF